MKFPSCYTGVATPINQDSAPGTIRGDFCVDVGRNLIHGSDSVDASTKEISLWFTEAEIARLESNLRERGLQTDPGNQAHLYNVVIRSGGEVCRQNGSMRKRRRLGSRKPQE